VISEPLMLETMYVQICAVELYPSVVLVDTLLNSEEFQETDFDSVSVQPLRFCFERVDQGFPAPRILARAIGPN
jgi:hypothetical protein